MNATINQLRSVQPGSAENSKFFSQFIRNRAYRNDALKVIQNEVLPAFKEYQDFIATKYLKHVRKGPGVVSMGNLDGGKYYQACLEFSTTIKNINATELYEFGMQVWIFFIFYKIGLDKLVSEGGP